MCFLAVRWAPAESASAWRPASVPKYPRPTLIRRVAASELPWLRPAVRPAASAERVNLVASEDAKMSQAHSLPQLFILSPCVFTAERVNLVASLDMPPSGASYAHRVGRTGRFGTAGIAVAFVTAAELPALRRLLAVVPGAQARHSASPPYPNPFLQPSCCALDG